MARIVYLHRDPGWAGFIADDHRILKRRHDVVDVAFRYSPRALAALVRLVRRSDLVYFYWGDVTGATGALVARAAGKRSIMVTGGYDVVSIPEIGYGLAGRPLRGQLPKLALRLADRIIVNAGSTRDGIVKAFDLPEHKVRSIPHGVDPDVISLGAAEREPIVLSVAQLNALSIRRKGIDTLVRAAASLPEHRFVIVGSLGADSDVRKLIRSAPKNVEFTGFLARADLYALMQRAAVVVQASAHEGFGLALAEAMLAGATPVVTRRGALPEVVGDAGEYVAYGDGQGTAAAIARVLAAPNPKRARAQIERNFPMARRETDLLALVDEVLG